MNCTLAEEANISLNHGGDSESSMICVVGLWCHRQKNCQWRTREHQKVVVAAPPFFVKTYRYHRGCPCSALSSSPRSAFEDKVTPGRLTSPHWKNSSSSWKMLFSKLWNKNKKNSACVFQKSSFLSQDLISHERETTYDGCVWIQPSPWSSEICPHRNWACELTLCPEKQINQSVALSLSLNIPPVARPPHTEDTKYGRAHTPSCKSDFHECSTFLMNLKMKWNENDIIHIEYTRRGNDSVFKRTCRTEGCQ